MKNKEWKYKIGGSMYGLIPLLFLLALFGGVSLWLYKVGNGAYFFTLIFTAFLITILVAVFYRTLFVKVLIYDDGFYHQTKPGKGKYYKYNEIKEAWISSGGSTTGVNNSFCNYKAYNGQVVKFSFITDESDGVDYLIERIKKQSSRAYSDDNTHNGTNEYQIDSKNYGITYIILSVVIFIVLSLIEIPMFLREVSASRWFGALFFVIGLLLPLFIMIRLVVRYFFYKVVIGNNRFYLQTNPFNGKYYEYSHIKSCKEALKVSRRRGQSSGGSRVYAYYFIFTDKTGKTREFQFQKNIHGHEIDILKERISLCNHCEVTEEVNSEGNTVVKSIIRVISLIMIAAVVVYLSYLLKNNLKPPSSDSSKNQADMATTCASNFYDVHTILSERGFETANIPTTYWFIEESKLTNVVSGVKGDVAFEFYEYTDGKTVDLVFNQISYDISKDMEFDEQDKYINDLPGESKIFAITENGIYSVVIYKDNTLVYAHSPETSNEIQDVLTVLGYIKKEKSE